MIHISTHILWRHGIYILPHILRGYNFSTPPIICFMVGLSSRDIANKTITFYTFSKYDYVLTNISSGNIILIHLKGQKNMILSNCA